MLAAVFAGCDAAFALMRRVEAGVQVSMSNCINRAVSIIFVGNILRVPLKEE